VTETIIKLGVPVVCAIVSGVFGVMVAQIGNLGRNQKKLIDNTKLIHDKIFKMMDYLQIEMSNADHIKKLVAIKNHYIGGIADHKLKVALSEVSSYFIDKVEYIIDTYDLSGDDIDNISTDLITCFHSAAQVFDDYIGVERSVPYDAHQASENERLLCDIEDILIDPSNHVVEKLIARFCLFLKTYLKDMKGLSHGN